MLNFILAQADAAPANPWMGNLLLFGGIAIIFYFFMIRPQQKKQKDQKNFIEAIKKGDAVVTIGGLHGKVYSVDTDTITLEVDKGMKLTFEKSAVSLDFTKKNTK
ncbi:preprotein translocase subunit YajC [Penaeicola halotolerans]|uniref:preprotein translocase subunit YajC n=1 Tax=Penaeicola halotolerans TaxID=2793196 RepID=UPI001CF90800|nr:preprotein translocase subunit YajC [Penaeicola halotolerans]